MSDAVTEQANERKTALGTLLIERGIVDQMRLADALRIGEDTGERLGEVLVRQGWASEDDLAKVLAEQWQLRYFERSAITFDGKALRRMSREDATKLEALPIQEADDGVVVVAVAEPTDARLHALRMLLGDRIDVVVVARTAIEAGLRSELLARNGSGEPETATVGGQFGNPDSLEAAQPSIFRASQAHDEWTPEQEDQEADAEAEPEHTGWTTEVVESTHEHDEVTGSHTTPEFDEVAKALSEGLQSQLDSLRAIVADTVSKHEHDRRELEQLAAELAASRAELAASQSEVADRSETIRSMQQTLREFADTLERGH